MNLRYDVTRWRVRLTENIEISYSWSDLSRLKEHYQLLFVILIEKSRHSYSHIWTAFVFEMNTKYGTKRRS